jgi:cell fate regulator YaaT (PSP1 superfamily)
MAESLNNGQPLDFMPRSVEDAREMAKQRFKERIENGEQVGNCDCHSGDASGNDRGSGPISRVAGIRFLDSGQTFFFDSQDFELQPGDWVVAETTRGKEAGRVVIAPHQVRASKLDGEVKPLVRKMNANDIEKMDRLKKDSARAVKEFGKKIREKNLPMKPIAAEYAFDGSMLTLSFSAPDRVDFRELARELSASFRCRIELRQVGARDEARLLGGLGRCGRTLCCSTWLPMFPDISMGMAKTQDLPLNPQKVSGVCGRLLCCLSYENEQYRQMKAIMPRLGQPIQTPAGPGMVVSMQILKETITVRLEDEGREEVFPADQLGFGAPRPAEPVVPTVAVASPVPALAPRRLESLAEPDTLGTVTQEAAVETESTDDDSSSAPGEESAARSRNRRRRRRGNRSGGSKS